MYDFFSMAEQQQKSVYRDKAKSQQIYLEEGIQCFSI